MTDSIKNYTLKEFSSQPQDIIEEYSNLLRFSTVIDTKNEIFKMKLRDVDFIKSSLGSGDDAVLFDIIALVQGIKLVEVLKIRVVEFFGLLASITEQVERIITTESKVLTPANDNAKWELVEGGKKMAKFGIYNTLDSLSGGDITKYEQILDMPYDDIFTIMYMRTVRGDLDQEMQTLKQ